MQYDELHNPEQVDPFGRAITRFLFCCIVIFALVIIILRELLTFRK